MSTNYPGINPLKYLGVRATNPPEQYFRKRAPTASDWEIYQIGDEWLDQSQSPPIWYKLVSKSRKNNTDPTKRGLWKSLTTTSTNNLSSLTGDSDTEVSPNSDHSIKLEGTSGEISVTEDTANNKLVFSLEGSGRGVLSLTPDQGTTPVIPTSSGRVSFLGSGSITTVGGANVLRTELTGLRNYSVLVGAGTSTITSLTPGTSGELLVGVHGNNPHFSSTSEGDFSFTQPLLISPTPRRLTVSNASLGETSSHAQVIASVGGPLAGDAHSMYKVGSAHSWAIGPDTSDAAQLKLTYSPLAEVTPSTGTEVFRASTSGQITFNNAYSFPTTAGSINQYLASNGSGALAFTNPAWFLHSSHTPVGGVINVAIPNTSFVYTWFLMITGVTTQTDGSQIFARVSIDNGATYYTTGYLSGLNGWAWNSAAYFNSNSTSQIVLSRAVNFTGSGTGAIDGYLFLTPGLLKTPLYGTTSYWDNTAGTHVQADLSAECPNSSAVITNIRFLGSSALVEGTVSLLGIRGT